MAQNDVTYSYLIPIGDLSLGERQASRAGCDTVLKANATRLAIRDRLDDMIIRDVLPNVDLGLAATDDWLVAGPGVAGTDLQYIGAAIPNDRVIAFWGCGMESAIPSISRLRLTLGAASSQVRGAFQLEQLYSRLEPVGYFSESIAFIRGEFCRVMVLPRLAFAANGQRFHLLARTIEPIGTTVSAPSV